MKTTVRNSMIGGALVLVAIFGAIYFSGSSLQSTTQLQSSVLKSAASEINVSKSLCKKLRTWADQGKLTSQVSSLKMNGGYPAACEKKFPEIWLKELSLTINESNCTLLKGWYDEGALTSKMKLQNINPKNASSCAQKFSSLWNKDKFEVNEDNCVLLKSWYDEGSLTPTMKERGIASQKASSCAEKFKDIWYDSSEPVQVIAQEAECKKIAWWYDPATGRIEAPFSQQDVLFCTTNFPVKVQKTVTENDCNLMKFWLETSGPKGLSERMKNNIPEYKGEDAGYCVQKYFSTQWYTVERTFEENQCQMMNNWLKAEGGSGLSARMRNYKPVLTSDDAKRCAENILVGRWNK